MNNFGTISLYPLQLARLGSDLDCARLAVTVPTAQLVLELDLERCCQLRPAVFVVGLDPEKGVQ